MEYIAVFLPLIGAIIAGFFGKEIGAKGVNFLTCVCMILAALASIVLLKHVALETEPRTLQLFTWIASGDLHLNWALRFDQLAAVMVFVINVVSACVHVYSVGYMSHDPCRIRFMSYLGLFTFAMLMLVTSDNFVQLFFGWEGVGLASYLLIGFWNKKHSANAAAVKAFVMNRIGDFGLALGIMTIFFTFGTLNFTEVFLAAPTHANDTVEFLGFNVHMISLACLLLFIGAMGKSAQLGLHTWLPDAMEGPTPVSALIHAATMVTAGVFLVARMSKLYEYAPDIQMFITVVGGLTALVAATIAITQNDIKRVIAYSTMSQLGYMFFALGVSAYGAAMFHLFTHAFFKALLFLGAGSVIHAMSDEQDMRKMGGIYKHIPVTYALMWIGSLSLAGLPFFSGFYSKDLILEAVFADHSWWGQFAFWCGIAAALLTAFYSWRLLFMTFHGKPRANEKVMSHIHESPSIMRLPLYVLAAGALFAGYLASPYFVGEGRHEFWGLTIFVLKGNDTIELAHHVEAWVKYLPILVAVLGIFIAWVLYIKTEGIPKKLTKQFKFIHRFLFNKWYFDELYHLIGVRPALALGRLFWKTGDKKVIDGLGPDGVADAVVRGAKLTGRAQSGYVYHYAFAMLMGVVALISYMLLG